MQSLTSRPFPVQGKFLQSFSYNKKKKQIVIVEFASFPVAALKLNGREQVFWFTEQYCIERF